MIQKKSPSTFLVTLALVLSLFGLAIIPFLLTQPTKFQTYPAFSKLLTGSLYATVCLVGVTAIFYPKSCENSLMFRNPPTNKTQPISRSQSAEIDFVGHHPACRHFSGNRIQVKKITFCAACTGLLIGALAALVGTILYFFVGGFPWFVDLRVSFVSLAGLLLGVFQFRFKGYAKLTVNALFVLSSFLLLTVTDALSVSLLINLYVLGVIVFLLLTRILLSGWNNKRICAKCGTCLLRG